MTALCIVCSYNSCVSVADTISLRRTHRSFHSCVACKSMFHRLYGGWTVLVFTAFTLHAAVSGQQAQRTGNTLAREAECPAGRCGGWW
jgi:hypothetical protein